MARFSVGVEFVTEMQMYYNESRVVTLGQRRKRRAQVLNQWLLIVSPKILEATGQVLCLSAYLSLIYHYPLSSPLASISIIPLQGLRTLPWGVPSTAPV